MKILASKIFIIWKAGIKLYNKLINGIGLKKKSNLIKKDYKQKVDYWIVKKFL